MRLLGIDYGRSKIGLAQGEGKLVEGLSVVRYKNKNKAIDKIANLIEEEGFDEVVVGFTEGKIGKEAKEFGKRLGEKISKPVHFQDETLSTRGAQKLSIEAGIKRKKRKKMEDAYAAALILQDYIDTLDE